MYGDGPLVGRQGRLGVRGKCRPTQQLSSQKSTDNVFCRVE